MTDASLDTAFQYDPFSQEAMRDPQSFYPSLREDHPAYFMPAYDSYVFSRYDDVWAAFMDTEHFSEAEGQVFSRDTLLVHHRGNPPEHQLEPCAMFTYLDAPVHNNLRRAMAPPFMKGSVAKLAPQITQMVREQLERLLPLGRFDLNADLGSYVSVGATALIMGIPLSDTNKIIDLVNTMVARSPTKSGPRPEGLIARAELIDFLKNVVAHRRVGDSLDSRLIDSLIRGDFLGRPLTDEEIANDLLAILVGGTETVPKIFAGGLLELSRQPQALAEIRADLNNNAPIAFEEMLRYNAPAQWFGRTVKKSCELAGVSLEPGQRVILLIAAANRDPREFDQADRFIWNRNARRMLSFGVGAHFCIGIHLARLEGQILLREFLAAVDQFEIEPEAGDWAISEFQVGWTSLPVRVQKAA